MKNLNGAIQTGVILLLLAAAAVLAFGVLTKTFVPFRVVESGSMTPILPVYSVIIVDKRSNYEPGDVITYKADKGEIVTHRLIKVNDDGAFITKGDANPTPDNYTDPVTINDVEGKAVYKIIYTAPSFWLSRSGNILFLSLVILAIAWWWPEDENEDSESTDKKGEMEYESATA